MPLSSSTYKALAWLALALSAALVLYVLGPVLAPFIVGAVLAYALHPLVDRCQAQGCPRPLAAAAVVLILILLLSGLFLLVVPIVWQELPLLEAQLPKLFQRLQESLAPWLGAWGLNLGQGWSKLQALLLQYLDQNGETAFFTVLNSLQIGGSVALTVAGHLLLTPVALFYFLLDWAAFVTRLTQWIPPRLRPALESFLHETDSILRQYLRGQIMVMGLMAGFYALGLSLFGLELAWPIGVFTGLVLFIPYVGFGIGLLLAFLAGVLQFSAYKALIMVLTVYGMGQLIEGFWLTPRLVGERIGLHPLAVIFALLAFGQLLGFVGVMVALPASAVTLVALRRLQSRWFKSPLYEET